MVLRLIPMSPVVAESFRFLPAQGPIPFVLGPLNGGLRCAPGFSQPDKKGWIFRLRNLYRFLPFARSTYRYASAIIVASSHMRAEFAAYRDKLFFFRRMALLAPVCSADSRKSGARRQTEADFRWRLGSPKSLLSWLCAAPLHFCGTIWHTLQSSAMAPSEAP